MIILIGAFIVIGSVVGGFMWEGGPLGALFHPSELLIIGGAALGAMVIMSPKKVLVDLIHQLLHTLKGAPYNRAAYEDLLTERAAMKKSLGNGSRSVPSGKGG